MGREPAASVSVSAPESEHKARSCHTAKGGPSARRVAGTRSSCACTRGCRLPKGPVSSLGPPLREAKHHFLGQQPEATHQPIALALHSQLCSPYAEFLSSLQQLSGAAKMGHQDYMATYCGFPDHYFTDSVSFLGMQRLIWVVGNLSPTWAEEDGDVNLCSDHSSQNCLDQGDGGSLDCLSSSSCSVLGSG